MIWGYCNISNFISSKSFKIGGGFCFGFFFTGYSSKESSIVRSDFSLNCFLANFAASLDYASDFWDTTPLLDLSFFFFDSSSFSSGIMSSLFILILVLFGGILEGA